MTEHFPPQDPATLLALCAGEWLSLRSRFDLGQPQGDDASAWHASERGELRQTWTAAEADGELLGVLESRAPDGTVVRLTFQRDGGLLADGGVQGQWLLEGEGRLQLSHGADGVVHHETIWFAKPNLRLRSLLARQGDVLLAAGFCSEVRRVTRPAP
ncbi:MAG: phycobiliprotein lyase [Cyanobacteriota bacterium]|nr:phycobiliprotein lyase [Cyanobacteriota bacterium]